MEKALPEAVPLPLGDDQLHEIPFAERLVAGLEPARVRLDRHDDVDVAMDDADRDPGPGGDVDLF